MPLELLPCAQCYYAILDKRPGAALIWFDLSNSLVEGSPFVYIQQMYKTEFSHLLEEDFLCLEESGYIVTHELPNAVWVIKYLGLEEGSPLICVGNHEE